MVLLFGAWLILGHGSYVNAVAADNGGQPNIILILADDLGREVLGCYGGTSHQTPNIDRLAAGGVRFTHVFVMPVCHPTRICLLTGQYPFRLGNPAWGTFPVEAESRTLAHVLKSAGYATAVVGKWQLALLRDDLDQPRRLGFDEYCLLGWHEGPWYYQPHIWQNGQRRTDVADRYGPDVIYEYLQDFITRHRSRPFFAFYSMTLCHSETNDLVHPAPVGPHGRYDNFREMVVKMDGNVGRLMKHLESLGLRDNTLILFLADNGTAGRSLIDAEGDEYVYETIVNRMGEREIPGGKTTLTDWGTRVPCILNWPGMVKPGDVSEMLVDASDVLPTLADAASASLPAGAPLDGVSMLARRRGAAGDRRWVFSAHRDRCFVRDKRWKLFSDGQFFDSEADPEERQRLDERTLSVDGATAHGELMDALELLGQKRGP
jgi:arylsulfatase A